MPIDVFPDDIETLRALVVAAFTERDAAIAERNRALSQIDRLRHLLRQLSRAHFGKRSEKLDPDQLLLALEDIEQAIAESEADDDKKDAIAAKARTEKRRVNRGALPRHLPRVDVTIAPEDTNCPCCRTSMHVIGEETSERLDAIPAHFRVIVTHRPKYACRACVAAPHPGARARAADQGRAADRGDGGLCPGSQICLALAALSPSSNSAEPRHHDRARHTGILGRLCRRGAQAAVSSTA